MTTEGRSKKRFGWIVPKDDGTNDVMIRDGEFPPEAWSEYERIIAVIGEMRPSVVDFLAVQTNAEAFAQLEATIAGDLDRMANQFAYLNSTDIIRHHVEIHRAATNFLSSATGFRTRTELRLKKKHGQDSTEFTAFKTMQRSEYDRSLGYRLLYNLRNFSEHEDAPIRSIPLKAERESDSAPLLSKVRFKLDCESLAQSSRVQTPVRLELKSLSERSLDFMPLVADYMLSLGRLVRLVMSLQADRLHEAQEYAKLIYSMPGIPDGAIPMIFEGQLPSQTVDAVKGVQSWRSQSSLFSIADLQLFGRLFKQLEDADKAV